MDWPQHMIDPKTGDVELHLYKYQSQRPPPN